MNNSNSNSKKLRLNCDCLNSGSEMAEASPSSCTPSTPTGDVMLIDDSEMLSNWHTRQITKCINDNAINRVLDSYLRIFQEVNTLNLQTNTSGGSVTVSPPPPPPPVRPNRSSNRFEESAILMAISEHGLQQNVVPAATEICNTVENMRQVTTRAIKLTSTPPSEISPSALQSSTTVPSTSSQHIVPTSSSSSMTANNFNDLELETNEILTSNPSSIESNDDIDFMEAAVAVAIQNKGLTPYSVSMSPTR